MKAIIKVEKEVNIKTIVIDIAPRHIGDSAYDDMPTDFPLLSKDKKTWFARVDVNTGIIYDWPQGEVREMYVKVCDQGIYTLLDENDQELCSIEGYVPNGLIPGEYGDYIDLKIDANGVITNWPKHPDLSAFFWRLNHDTTHNHIRR